MEDARDCPIVAPTCRSPCRTSAGAKRLSWTAAALRTCATRSFRSSAPGCHCSPTPTQHFFAAGCLTSQFDIARSEHDLRDGKDRLQLHTPERAPARTICTLTPNTETVLNTETVDRVCATLSISSLRPAALSTLTASLSAHLPPAWPQANNIISGAAAICGVEELATTGAPRLACAAALRRSRRRQNASPAQRGPRRERRRDGPIRRSPIKAELTSTN